MFGLLIIICVFAVFGFFYSWIAQMVSREEVPIWKGVVILITAGIGSAIGSALVEGAMPGASTFVSPFITFGALTLMSHVVAGLSPKHSAIVAGVYSVLSLILGFALGACVAASS
jgi:hypothetical protein